MAVVSIQLTDNVSDLVNKINELGTSFGDINTLNSGAANLVEGLNAVDIDSAAVTGIIQTELLVVPNDDPGLNYDSATGTLTSTSTFDSAAIKGLISLTFNSGFGTASYSSTTGVINITHTDSADVVGAISNHPSQIVDSAQIVDDAINSFKLADVQTLVIYNSAGTAVKTLYGAGS